MPRPIVSQMVAFAGGFAFAIIFVIVSAWADLGGVWMFVIGAVSSGLFWILAVSMLWHVMKNQEAAKARTAYNSVFAQILTPLNTIFDTLLQILSSQKSTPEDLVNRVLDMKSEINQLIGAETPGEKTDGSQRPQN